MAILCTVVWTQPLENKAQQGGERSQAFLSYSWNKDGAVVKSDPTINSTTHDTLPYTSNVESVAIVSSIHAMCDDIECAKPSGDR